MENKIIKNEVLEIKKILEILPHRYPFLLVDRVTYINDQTIKGIKNITLNEPQFMGHFPNNPVMPGVLIIEAMAQLAAILVAQKINTTAKNCLIYLMSIENAKFRKIVTPGDALQMECKIIKNRNNIWKFSCSSYIQEGLAAEAEIMAMGEYKNK